jgi:hypothetical protein
LFFDFVKENIIFCLFKIAITQGVSLWHFHMCVWKIYISYIYMIA